MSTRALASLVALVALTAPAWADDGFLRFLPSDAKVVLVVNVTALAEKDRKTGEGLVRQLYSAQLAPELKKLDKLPLGDLKQVVIAQPYAGGFGGVIVLRGKIDSKLMEQQLREASKASKGALAVESLGKPAVPVFRRKLNEKQLLELFPMMETVPAFVRKMIAPQEAIVAAIDDETFFVSLSGKAALERALRARAKDARLRTSQELTKLLKGRDKKDIATAVLMDDCLHPGIALLVPQETRDTFEQFSHLVTRIQGGKKIGVTLTVTGKTKENAQTLEKTAETTIANALKGLPTAVPDKAQREALEGLLKSFKVSRKDSVVTVAGSLSEDDARKLLPKVPKKD